MRSPILACPDPGRERLRRIVRGFWLALLSAVVALGITALAGCLVLVLHEILVASPRLFGVGVFAPTLAIVVRFFFSRAREEG